MFSRTAQQGQPKRGKWDSQEVDLQKALLIQVKMLM